jgi:D-3-phosphoglycerate dehydrogenase
MDSSAPLLLRRELMLAHPELRVIARQGVGFNNVDVGAARELNRRVTIAPGDNERRWRIMRWA